MSRRILVGFWVVCLLLFFAGSGCNGGKPDLVVDSITLKPASPTTCVKTLFEAVIKNTGSKGAGSSVAAMWVKGETDPRTFTIPALAPGASHSFQRTEMLFVVRNYRVRVVADYSQGVEEGDENNNEGQKDFTVTGACPDLVVKMITITPANPVTGEVTEFETHVINIGNCPAPATKLAFWVGDETDPELFAVPALNPGAVHVVTRYEKFTVPQTFRTRAEADYGDNAGECNENNNKNQENFTVQ